MEGKKVELWLHTPIFLKSENQNLVEKSPVGGLVLLRGVGPYLGIVLILRKWGLPTSV